MARMMPARGATARDTDPSMDRVNPGSTTAMALQTQRAYEAAPQMLVRLTGSYRAKPRAATMMQRASATT